MGSVIDMCIDNVVMKDEVYRYSYRRTENIFEDYVAWLMSANERACNLLYLVSARNTIQFLSEINALKTDSV